MVYMLHMLRISKNMIDFRESVPKKTAQGIEMGCFFSALNVGCHWGNHPLMVGPSGLSG